jgi:cell division protein FtsB
MPLFYLCLALCGVLLAALAMFFNYSLRLDARTVKLEKKNGKELAEIAKLKEEIRKLKGGKHD